MRTESLDQLDVSRETQERLELFVRLLIAENEQQNLISKSTIPHVWDRHIRDAAQLVALAPAGGSWLDIGSGGGLPGLVIAILTGSPVVLVEPRRLRAAFLQRMIAQLDLGPSVQVIQSRIETVQSVRPGIITARAVAPVERLFAMASHLSHRGTIWVLPKGRGAKSELDEARRTWQGDFRLEPSRTDPEAQILIASRVRRIPGAGGVR